MVCTLREGVYQKIFICITRKRHLFILYVLHHAHQRTGGVDGSITRKNIFIHFYVLHHAHQRTGRRAKTIKRITVYEILSNLKKAISSYIKDIVKRNLDILIKRRSRCDCIRDELAFIKMKHRFPPPSQ